jgi:molybdopterin converting factor small subunit
MMRVSLQFYSYFRELAGCHRRQIELPAGGTIDDLLRQVYTDCPKLKAMSRAMLVAVGVEYQDRSYVLTEGDEVALFPPVQGG